MDPTANLDELCVLVTRMQKCSDANHAGEKQCYCKVHGGRLSDLILSLYGWIAKGGFLPNQYPKK
jgi:hypothetical protein